MYIVALGQELLLLETKKKGPQDDNIVSADNNVVMLFLPRDYIGGNNNTLDILGSGTQVHWTSWNGSKALVGLISFWTLPWILASLRAPRWIVGAFG